MKEKINKQLNAIKYTAIVVAMVLVMVLMTGCRKDEQVSKECIKAYDDNRQVYDYSGELPEECKK